MSDREQNPNGGNLPMVHDAPYDVVSDGKALMLAPRKRVAQGGGGGIVHREIARLKKWVQSLKPCCPPELLDLAAQDVTTSGNVDISGPGSANAYGVDSGASLSFIQITGTASTVTINSFVVTNIGSDGLQTIAVDADVDTPVDGQTYAMVVKNPCGCAMFLGRVTISGA